MKSVSARAVLSAAFAAVLVGCGSGGAPSDAGPEVGDTGSPRRECTAPEECPYHPCECADGQIVNGRTCDRGTCTSVSVECTSTCPELGHGAWVGAPSGRDAGPADAAPDAGRTAPPAGALRVFVTRTSYTGDLEDAASAPDTAERAGDRLCETAARVESLGSEGRWRAWLSSGSNNAIARVTGPGPWYDLTGRVVFRSAAQLATTPDVGLEIDERGDTVREGYVWTGTRAGGTALRGCLGWAAGGGAWVGTAGAVGATTSRWTDVGSELPNGGLECDQSARLVCFEVR